MLCTARTGYVVNHNIPTAVGNPRRRAGRMSKAIHHAALWLQLENQRDCRLRCNLRMHPWVSSWPFLRGFTRNPSATDEDILDHERAKPDTEPERPGWRRTIGGDQPRDNPDRLIQMYRLVHHYTEIYILTMTLQRTLERVTDGEDLTQSEAREATAQVFEQATDAQIGALLAALRAKGETEAEIAGFATGMRDAARRIAPDRGPLVDTCGTGGDDYDTINVSTTSAVVAAGAGAAVAKHGNYSVSSSSGSADVLEVAGVNVAAEPPAVEQSIENHGIGFMLAGVFHPAMKAVIGPRRELGMRTVFNVLGPLTNPAGADAQVIGVYDPELVPQVAASLAQLPVERAMVVHGAGMDEIALHEPTVVAEVTGSSVEEYTIEPADLGLETAPVDAVAGGTPQENASDLEGIVTGELEGPKRDLILANAGAAVYVAGLAASLSDGVAVAEKAIDDGGAAAKLDALRTATPAERGEE